MVYSSIPNPERKVTQPQADSVTKAILAWTVMVLNDTMQYI